VAIIEAYSHATAVDRRGAVMLGDEMIDEASRKMAQAVVARGNAAGFTPQKFPDAGENS
jgi:citrate lyase subunit beta / citryl-CoA lyase